MRRERTDHTLSPTALVHEAYLRLVGQTDISWQNRAHFFSVAAQVMRHILVDHARERRAQKRGGSERRLSLEHADISPEQDATDLLALDEALTRLAAFDERKSRVVELRFFGGPTIEEVAEVLKVTEGAVRYDWRMAKAWLHRALCGGQGGGTAE